MLVVVVVVVDFGGDDEEEEGMTGSRCMTASSISGGLAVIRICIPRAVSAAFSACCSFRFLVSAARRRDSLAAESAWAWRMRVCRVRKARCSAEGRTVVLMVEVGVGDVRARPRLQVSSARSCLERARRAREER